jgi:Scaffold protein Nfu/NifU N terminal
MLTPNPDAMKFTLDIELPARLLANRGDDVGDPFTRALLAVDGVASVFGINDFVTVTREHDADWEPIICAVEDAAAEHLPSCPAGPEPAAVERARALLRDAVRKPEGTAVEIRPSSREDPNRS